MAGFLEQLSAVELRYEEMTHLLSQPDVAGNNQRYTALMKEYTALTPLVGYENGAKIAKKAHKEDISLKEAAVALGLIWRYRKRYHYL